MQVSYRVLSEIPYGVLRDEIADYVKRESYTLCSHKDGVGVVEANVQADHVHLVLSIPPKDAVSNLMGYLKGKLAIRVFNRYEHLRQRYRSGHLWSRGYWVSTVGLDEENIRRYVKWQETKGKQDEAHQRRVFE
jgi:putative transposase